MRLYSLLDKKAATFGSIMMAPTDGMMCRTIEEMTQEGHTVRRYPEDFDLYYVGDFDDQSGRVGEPEAPGFIVNMAVIFRKREV